MSYFKGRTLQRTKMNVKMSMKAMIKAKAKYSFCKIKLFLICKAWTEVLKEDYFTILCSVGQITIKYTYYF